MGGELQEKLRQLVPDGMITFAYDQSIVLKKVKVNKSKAAKILKVSRNTLKKKSIAV